MCRMDAAEIEVGNEHGNRMTQVFQFLAVSNRATGEPARERANAQVCALAMAGCGRIHIRIPDALLFADGDNLSLEIKT